MAWSIEVEEGKIDRIKRIRHRLELIGVRIMVWLPSLLPLRLSVRLASILGIIAFDIVRIRRDVSIENLRRAFGDRYTPKERRKIARRSYINFAKSMIEFASLKKQRKKRLIELVRLTGRQYVDDALDKGAGVVVVTGHFGSWEFLGAAAVAHGFEVDFLVGRQGNRMVDALMNDLRRGAGIGIISRGVAARGIFRSLKKKRLVALLSDQDARKHGIFVDFFGIPASTYPGAAQFACRTGCPIIFCYIVRKADETHETVFMPPIEVDRSAPVDKEILRLTAAHVKALEDCVRKYPDHYFWAHKRWKTSPDPGKDPS
ncbi:MAG: lysophospholipid acyltransferase family protein [Candidatus Krumholzibacteriota bacterium]|nr:lysophospholipid acyltransferase family protein [Candidatus Krumholzibacteriota bacterium]